MIRRITGSVLSPITILALVSLLNLVTVQVQAVTIDWIPVGNAGNANDPATGNHFGGVGYDYLIDKYDVTVGQYTEFLNAVAKADTYGLYNPNMASDTDSAGISRGGASGSYSYSVIGSSANLPITYVNWGDAVRFANWLQNGQPIGPQGAGTTETGSYTLNGAVTQAALNAVTRNPDAKFVLPSENEWYKAAFYNPASSSYYAYPFSSNTVPTAAPPGSTPNTANYFDTEFALAGPPYVNAVGAYTGSMSPYGAYDMGGNVWQWNEALILGTSRGVRGGTWNGDSVYLRAALRNYYHPLIETSGLGFRVAAVPEPSTGVLATLACGLLWGFRKRFK